MACERFSASVIVSHKKLVVNKWRKCQMPADQSAVLIACWRINLRTSDALSVNECHIDLGRLLRSIWQQVWGHRVKKKLCMFGAFGNLTLFIIFFCAKSLWMKFFKGMSVAPKLDPSLFVSRSLNCVCVTFVHCFKGIL